MSQEYEFKHNGETWRIEWFPYDELYFEYRVYQKGVLRWTNWVFWDRNTSPTPTDFLGHWIGITNGLLGSLLDAKWEDKKAGR